jgi:hypothetical protein
MTDPRTTENVPFVDHQEFPKRLDVLYEIPCGIFLYTSTPKAKNLNVASLHERRKRTEWISQHLSVQRVLSCSNGKMKLCNV